MQVGNTGFSVRRTDKKAGNFNENLSIENVNNATITKGAVMPAMVSPTTTVNIGYMATWVNTLNFTLMITLRVKVGEIISYLLYRLLPYFLSTLEWK